MAPASASSTNGRVEPRKKLPLKDFGLSGMSAVCAICITNPVDVVKTRLQLQGEQTGNLGTSPGGKVYRGVGQSLLRIWRLEGMRGLNRGLGPACLLQFSSVGTRFGAYNVAKTVCDITPETPYRFVKSMGLAGCTGAISACVGCPFFLLKTRLQSATTDPSITVGRTAWDGNAGTVAACRAVYRADGIRGFYRGLPALMLRIGAASAVQLATYDSVKTAVLTQGNAALNKYDGSIDVVVAGRRFHDGSLATHFVSAWITSLAMVLAMQPFDFAATRMMNDGSGLYSSSLGVLYDTARGHEGVLGIFKGTWANWMRFGPYTILVFIFMEQFKSLADGQSL